MTLAEHDEKVRPHLNFIEAGAQMAARHARAIPVRMPFETRAQDELKETRAVLENALRAVIAAQEAYEAKPVERV
jgi:hypothetical protein